MLQGEESNTTFDATDKDGEPSIESNLVTGFKTSSLGIGFHYSKRVKFKGQFTTSEGMFDTEGKGKGARFFKRIIIRYRQFCDEQCLSFIWRNRFLPK